MKLTKDAIAGLAPPVGKAEHFEWDDDVPGFGVRLRRGGANRAPVSRRWVIQYRAGSQQRRESLGDVRKVNLEDARKIARQRFAQVELGIDPAAERGRSRAQAVASKLTLAVVAARYLDAKKDMLRPRTFNQAELHFRVHWKPLRDRPIEAIKRADVAARLQELVKGHGRTSAARARGNLSALYNWAMKEGLCEVNPVIATNDPEAGILPRDRVLADSEIENIWNACEDDAGGRIIKLLLLTGCRREEIGGLCWSEIDPETGVMTIPGARTKNRRTLALPLPAIALDLIASMPRQEGRDYLFGRSGGPFSGWSATKLRLDARIAMKTGRPLAPWTFHDARRSMRTGLGRLGVPPHVAELCINHVKGGVEAIYDRYRYQSEIKAALALWAEHVLAVVEGRQSKIVPLRG
jgi:integrase